MSYKTNFYNYINQEWLDNNEIPKGYSRWGTFNEIDKQNIMLFILNSRSK